MSRIVVFGAGDIARLAHVYFTNDSEHEVVAFTADRAYCTPESFRGLPLVPSDEIARLFSPREHGMFVAMSYAKMNQVRAGKVREAQQQGYTLVSYVSSRCTFLTEHPVGHNCFILEDNTIQPFVRIGHDVTLWSGNHIGHDVVIEDHCFVTSHVVISGHTHVGAYSFLGVNATLRNGIRLAPRTLVGAGAILMADTVEGGVYMPPRSSRLEKRSDEIDL